MKVININTTSSGLAGKVTNFTQQILNKEPFESTSHELYNLLLKPIEEQLRGKSKITIIPDSLLWNLPFHALINSNNRFLIEDYSVSHISATIDRLLAQNVKLPNITKRLVISNPTLNADAIERIGS